MATEERNGRHANSSVTIQATTTVVQAANNRKYLMLINLSTTAGEIIWVKTDGTAATVGAGIPRDPNRGSYEPLLPPSGAINAIAASGTPSLSLTWA